MITKAFLLLIKIVCFFYTNYEKSIIFAGKIKQKKTLYEQNDYFCNGKTIRIETEPIHSTLRIGQIDLAKD